MAKDKQRDDGPTQVVLSVRRHAGQWIYERAVIPQSVYRQYVEEEHGPDLWGMCAAKLEVDMAKARGLE